MSLWLLLFNDEFKSGRKPSLTHSGIKLLMCDKNKITVQINKKIIMDSSYT